MHVDGAVVVTLMTAFLRLGMVRVGGERSTLAKAEPREIGSVYHPDNFSILCQRVDGALKKALELLTDPEDDLRFLQRPGVGGFQTVTVR